MRNLILFLLGGSTVLSAQMFPFPGLPAAMYNQVAKPVDSPGSGSYGSAQTISLTVSAPNGSTICYTVDGSTPAASTPGTCSAGTTYSGSFTSPGSSFTLKALGTKAGWPNSAVLSSAYTIGGALTYSLVQQKPTGADVETTCSLGAIASTSTTCTFNSTPSVGDLVTVAVATYGVTTVSVTDNQSNTYTCVQVNETTNHNDNAQCYSTLAASSGTFTVTVHVTASSYLTIHMFQWHRSSGSWTFDASGTNTASGSSASSIVPPSPLTTTGNPGLLVAAATFAASSSGGNTAGSGYTLLRDSSSAIGSTVIMGLTTEWPTSAPNAGAQTATINFGSTQALGYASTLLAFK